MEINALRAFVTTARLGSFSAASLALGLSQPALSRQIKHLEREIGQALLNREHRPVGLTQAGEDFLPSASSILETLDKTLRKFERRNSLAGSLSIAASTIPGEFLVPQLLVDFAGHYPDVRPLLSVGDSASVVTELLAPRSEIGFLGVPHADRRILLIPFARDEIVLAVPVGHVLALLPAVSLSDLAGQSFVERTGGSGTLQSVRLLLAKSGRALPPHRVALEVSTSQAHVAAIAAGAGIGFLSSRVLAGHRLDRVVPVTINDLKLRRTLYLAHKQAPLSPVADAFLQFALEYSAEHGLNDE